MKKWVLAILLAAVIGLMSWNRFLGELIPALEVFSRHKPDLVLATSLVQTITGEAKGDVSQAKEEAVSRTLKALGLAHWQNLPQFNSFILWGDLLPAAGEELILAFSQGRDQGAVAVFQRGARGYELAEILRGLVPITHVALIGLEGFPYRALIIDEYLDEMSGAFYKVKTKAIYIHKGQGLVKIWERDRYRKEYYPEGGELQGPRTRWLMRKEEAAIVFSPQGHITVTGIRVQGRNKELGQIAGQYELLARENFGEYYAWDARSLSYRRQDALRQN